MTDKVEILRAVKQQLQRLYGDRLAKVILFGSYARGDFKDGSDMDFLVVLKDDEIGIGEELRYMSAYFPPLIMDYNIYISRHPTTLKLFETSDYHFFRNIRKEGVEI